MTSYFRIQSANRDPADLLDPAQQISYTWGADTTQDGVSVCESRDDLAAYLAGPGQGIPYGDGEWVVVEVAGKYLGDGQDVGEVLIRPAAILSVVPADDDFFALIGRHFDEAYA